MTGIVFNVEEFKAHAGELERIGEGVSHIATKISYVKVGSTSYGPLVGFVVPAFHLLIGAYAETVNGLAGSLTVTAEAMRATASQYEHMEEANSAEAQGMGRV